MALVTFASTNARMAPMIYAHAAGKLFDEQSFFHTEEGPHCAPIVYAIDVDGGKVSIECNDRTRHHARAWALPAVGHFGAVNQNAVPIVVALDETLNTLTLYTAMGGIYVSDPIETNHRITRSTKANEVDDHITWHVEGYDMPFHSLTFKDDVLTCYGRGAGTISFHPDGKVEAKSDGVRAHIPGGVMPSVSFNLRGGRGPITTFHNAPPLTLGREDVQRLEPFKTPITVVVYNMACGRYAVTIYDCGSYFLAFEQDFAQGCWTLPDGSVAVRTVDGALAVYRPPIATDTRDGKSIIDYFKPDGEKVDGNQWTAIIAYKQSDYYADAKKGILRDTVEAVRAWPLHNDWTAEIDTEGNFVLTTASSTITYTDAAIFCEARAQGAAQ